MIIVQARMGSTRLPGKVMMDLGGQPMIRVLHDRIQGTGLRFVYAIPEKDRTPLGHYLESIGGEVFCWDGPEDDVAGRFKHCIMAAPEWPDIGVFCRVCADSPYAPVEFAAMAAGIAAYKGYGLIQTQEGSIEAAAVQLFLDALPKMTPEEREHVLVYFRRHRLVVDTAEDMERVRAYAG